MSSDEDLEVVYEHFVPIRQKKQNKRRKKNIEIGQNEIGQTEIGQNGIGPKNGGLFPKPDDVISTDVNI